MSKTFDYELIIIGAGPGGLTSAIYAKRGGINVAVVEGGTPGGNIVVTQKVDNYPGCENIDGPALAYQMYDQVLKLGVKFIYSMAQKITPLGEEKGFEVILANGKKLTSQFVFIATGMKPKKPDIESLIAKENHGVSYCAICDGALYKNEEVLIIGAGNSAVEESFFLLNICKKVHIVMRRDVFRADKEVVDRLKSFSNVVLHQFYLIDQVLGDEVVDGVIIKNIQTGEIKKLPNVKAIFPYIGHLPQTDFLLDLNITNEAGFIEVDKHFETNIKGLYAIGDVIVKELRQIVTATADGAIAAKNIMSKVHAR